MGQRGNPYDNAKAESFMKTLKVEGVYPIAFETFADVVDHPLVSSTRSAMTEGSIQPSATSALFSSRVKTLAA